MKYSKVDHWMTAKMILKRVKSSLEYNIMYVRRDDFQLINHTDLGPASSVDQRKSTIGYAFILSTSTISWLSKKQHAAALSSRDTYYMATVSAACEVIWLRRITVNSHVEQVDPTRLMQHVKCSMKLEISFSMSQQTLWEYIVNTVQGMTVKDS